MTKNLYHLNRSSVIHLIGLVLLCLAVAGIAGAVTVPAVRSWYPALVHPSFAPPNAVFGPVWTVLYILMAVAAWRAWRIEAFRWDSVCIRLFASQLGLNFAWSFLFFGSHQMGLALIEIICLWAAVGWTLRAFMARDRIAGLLMLPYFAWVGFAALLNFAFWRLN